MTRERCTVCDAVLLWANHRLVCPRPHCPAPTNLVAQFGLQRDQGAATPAAVTPAAGERAAEQKAEKAA